MRIGFYLAFYVFICRNLFNFALGLGIDQKAQIGGVYKIQFLLNKISLRYTTFFLYARTKFINCDQGCDFFIKRFYSQN